MSNPEPEREDRDQANADSTPTISKEAVKEALSEILEEIPAFRAFRGRAGTAGAPSTSATAPPTAGVGTGDSTATTTTTSSSSSPGTTLTSSDGGVDCSQVTVSVSSAIEPSGYTDVTITVPNLTPLYASANRVRFYIWSLTPSSLNLDISTRNLERVAGWRESSCAATDQNRFQTARIMATAEFGLGSGQSFETDVLPLIANDLRIEGDAARITDAQRGILQGVEPGTASLIYNGPVTSFTVADAEVNITKIDPILASLRMDLTDIQADSRLSETVVSLEILSGLFFFEERTEVTMSVILENGRRIVIRDASEIQLQSSNSSILSVDGNFVIASGVGTAELTVTWVVCNVILGRSTIDVTVEFSENRPIFENNPQTAQILENSPLGSTIVTVFANDMDFVSPDDTRRDTEYRFADESFSHGGLFLLDRITGLVTLNAPIDREVQDSYELRIEATDRTQRQAEQQQQGGSEDTAGEDVSGSGLGSGSGGGLLMPSGTRAPATPTPIFRDPIDVLTLTVQVGDVNDNRPVCPRLPTLTLDRNAAVGTSVVFLDIMDADIGINAEIVYSGIRGEFAPQFLDVDDNTGEIVLSSALDSFTEASALQPLVDISDRGSNPGPNLEVCQLTIDLFSLEDTVTATVVVIQNLESFDPDTFDQILQNILDLEIEVTRSNQLNDTHYSVDFLGRDGQVLIAPSIITRRLSNLTAQQTQLLMDAGLSIIEVVANDDVLTTQPPVVPTRPFPTWAVVVIVVLNSVIIIAVLLLILGIVWRRYKRMREQENQRNLNKKTGLTNIADVEMESADGGEQIEMGGIVDPERGALIYRKTTHVETVEPEDGSEFTVKKIKKVTSESTWIGQGKEPEKAQPPEQDEVKPWHDDELESNPLYSSSDYASDFQNPLYTNRQSAAIGDWTMSSPPPPPPAAAGEEEIEMSDTTQLVPGKSRASRGHPESEESEDAGGQGYMDYLAAQPGLDTVDTLF